MNRKTCCLCKKEKNMDDFSKSVSRPDGHNNTCKECHSIYRKNHYEKNKEKIRKQVDEYRNKNPEKYNRKFLNRKINKKGGRTIPIKCCNPNCNEIIYVTKKTIAENISRFCSLPCKNFKRDKFTNYLNDLRKRAIKKNMEFNIDRDFIKNLLENKQNNKCAITNISIKFSDTTKIYKTPSLDRIKNKLGYTKDNVQWVVLGVNYMKMYFSNDDLKKTLKLIVENYK